MKKLKLKALELGAMELLTRAQLKNVLGGTEGYGMDPTYECWAKPEDGYMSIKPGNCTGSLNDCNAKVREWCRTAEGCDDAWCGGGPLQL